MRTRATLHDCPRCFEKLYRVVLLVPRPGFRDGAIAQSVEEVVAADTLYFTAAGDDGFGSIFTSVRFLRFISITTLESKQNAAELGRITPVTRLGGRDMSSLRALGIMSTCASVVRQLGF